MSNAVLGQLKGAELTHAEAERLRDFIQENTGSNLALVLRAILLALEDGQSVNVLADDAELSPNEAAKLLKMSRPHLLKFMRDGYLPFHMVGSHQRIRMSDLTVFMQAREAGAEILADALHGTPQEPETPATQPLSDSEINDLGYRRKP